MKIWSRIRSELQNAIRSRIQRGFTKEQVWAALGQYGCMMLGAAILSFGLYNVHSQSQITEGGVLGMQLFLQHWFGISPSVSGIVMDLTCYAAGFRLLGKTFLKNAVVASCCFSLFYRINENVIGHVLPNLGEMPVLAAVVGGMFVGVGVGLIVRAGGASGGDDALAMIISKLSKKPLAKAYFMTDFVVLMLSLTYIPAVKIACSLITVSLSSFIIGKIHGDKAIGEEEPKEEGAKAEEEAPLVNLQSPD